MGERRTTFSQAYGMKMKKCYWELFEEHVRNLGTLCFDPPPTTSFEATTLARTTNMTRQWSGPHWVKLSGFFFGQFCDVAKVMIIHR